MLLHHSQNNGLVPIVEPEILLDGDHDITRCLEVFEEVWAETFKYLADNKVSSDQVLFGCENLKSYVCFD